MDRQAADLQKWKDFFDTSKSDLWTVIDRAITIAALQYPAELRARRDKYTEKLFCPTSHLAGLCECQDDEEEAEEDEEDEEDEDKGDKDKEDTRDSESDVSAPSAVVRRGKGEEQDDAGDNEEERTKSSRGCSFMDVEALSDEMEEESRRMKEINKLKVRISNSDEYEDYLCEDLEALERMNISFEQLKASEIGRPVNNLRKHPSANVRAIVKRLIKNWKALADEWARSAEHVTARGSYGTNDDDYGLPSPPVDEGELLAAGSTPLELFDFMEDDLSGGSGAEMNSQMKEDNSPVDLVNGIYEDAHSPTDGGYASRQQQQLPKKPSSDSDRQRPRKDSTAAVAKATGEQRDHNKRSMPSILKPSTMNGKNESNRKSSSTTTTTAGPRPAKSTSAVPSSSGLQRPKPPARPRPEDRMTSSNKNKNFAEEDRDKLAAAKRKLHEGYQQAENAKKQRTVQVMDLTELPKGKGGPKAVSKAKPHPQHNHRYSGSSHIRR